LEGSIAKRISIECHAKILRAREEDEKQGKLEREELRKIKKNNNGWGRTRGQRESNRIDMIERRTF